MVSKEWLEQTLKKLSEDDAPDILLKRADFVELARELLAWRKAADEPFKLPKAPFTFEEIEEMHSKEFARGYFAGWASEAQFINLAGDLFRKPDLTGGDDADH